MVTSTTDDDLIHVTEAGYATIYLSAATNYVSYKDVSNDPNSTLDPVFEKLKEQSYETVKELHISDYRSLFDRFELDFGNNHRDTLPTDQRILMFSQSPEDPATSGPVHPVRTLPAHFQQSSRHPSCKPPGNLEQRPGTRLGQQVYHQHQYGNELLAGGGKQSLRMHRTPFQDDQGVF